MRKYDENILALFAHHAGVLLFMAAAPFFRSATALSGQLGVLAALPLLPLLWLLFGSCLCLGTVILKKLVMPRVAPEIQIPVFSVDFARWWLVHRAIAMTNHLFVRHLRGTGFLPAYLESLVGYSFSFLLAFEPLQRASYFLLQWLISQQDAADIKGRVQGARVGTNAFIDTLDFMDPDMLDIGDEVAIGEGATVLGHSFRDGMLCFSKVSTVALAGILSRM